MSLAGHGAVAIWHDLAPEGRDEFYAWHGTEHMPERVGIPGFLRGRRYVARSADLEFFNLYEAHTHADVVGRAYLERLENPTPWTVSTVKHFRNVARSICRVEATFGAGQGGIAATWRYDVAPARSAEHLEALSRMKLPGIAGQGFIAGAHLLIADEAASAVVNAEEKARGAANLVPRWIVIVEGWGDEGIFDAYCRQTLSDSVLKSAGAVGPIDFGLYRLQATASRSDSELRHQ